MSQNPINVTYSLEEILGQINQKLDTLQKDVTEIKIGQVKLEAEIKGDIKSLETELKGNIKSLETELKGDKLIGI
ncbi:MAG TPA: shikimate dehydrogenase [Trichormus sp. M33_DOE_039]|nr:shikimate dehydrogenase [Trichormus sp. M33_DOE_039]